MIAIILWTLVLLAVAVSAMAAPALPHDLVPPKETVDHVVDYLNAPELMQGMQVSKTAQQWIMNHYSIQSETQWNGTYEQALHSILHAPHTKFPEDLARSKAAELLVLLRFGIEKGYETAAHNLFWDMALVEARLGWTHVTQAWADALLTKLVPLVTPKVLDPTRREQSQVEHNPRWVEVYGLLTRTHKEKLEYRYQASIQAFTRNVTFDPVLFCQSVERFRMAPLEEGTDIKMALANNVPTDVADAETLLPWVVSVLSQIYIHLTQDNIDYLLRVWSSTAARQYTFGFMLGIYSLLHRYGYRCAPNSGMLNLESDPSERTHVTWKGRLVNWVLGGGITPSALN